LITVLVVDDEPVNLDLIKGILPEDYKMKAATSGEKALMIAAKVPHPDIILLDVMMPVMDGYEVCRQLKASPDTSAIPVVFISGHDDEAEKQMAANLGGAGFISKPVNPEAMLDLLKKLATTVVSR
jgi:CheY-like chemotaxis protein